MAFTGYRVFPGLSVVGIVSPAILDLVATFNLEAINALQIPSEEDLAWADGICGVTPAVFRGKVPLDLTALDGFEEFKGTREFKQIDLIAIQADVSQWQRNVEWDIRLDQAGNAIREVYQTGSLGASVVAHSRVMKARLAASAIMLGTPTTAKAKVYAGNDIPGAGLSLFNAAHFANPMDPKSRTFPNYFQAVGPFTPNTMGLTRKRMRQVPSPTMRAETLGVQVTDIIGGTIMEEPFRQVALSALYLQVASSTGTGAATGTGVAAAPTNIYSQATTPCRFWIAPQLDADPYYAANADKHMWISVSRKLPGAHPIEMVAPTKEFTPLLKFLGDGTESAAMTRKVRLLGDLDAGVAAGLPHVIQRFEET